MGPFSITDVRSQCEKPAIRREWRELDAAGQVAFLEAVTCLVDTPSVLTGKGSVYDDLALVHRQIGAKTHMLASFFPWHRTFLHVFESLLEENCDYRNGLPYWDWTLDWQNITASPVFDATYGFGGNGYEGDESGCVRDGPLRTASLLYGPEESYDEIHPTHCLNRVFRHYENHTLGSISGQHLRPASIRWISKKPTYDGFRNATEILAHNSLHWGFHGDFSSNAAANGTNFCLATVAKTVLSRS
ncbi:hypothetical protein LTR10_007462 [Elasticomyces elasticus]|nr:hypothetical protein LTR10_007462 [Elasticomyces elasticus]